MEDYDKFVQRCLPCLSKNNDSNKPSSTTSVIRVYGHPILPPLLTGGKRAEMQKHREEAQTADRRRMKDAARLAHLQEMLPQQQLCQAPTLEGILHESESDEKSSSSQDIGGGSVLQNSPFTGASAVFPFSPPPEEKEKDESHQLLVPSPSGGKKEKDGASAPPLTVTPRSAFFAAPQPEHQKSCLINQHTGQQVTPTHGLSIQPSIHDLEKPTGVSCGSVAGKDGRLFGPPDGAYDAGSVFQHSPSNTVAKMPKIICYPPLDGDELEGSGLESWFGRGFIISQGVSHSLGTPDASADEDGGPHLHGAASTLSPSFPSVINYKKDHSPDKAKPVCVNLQALLRRSQEYRRHQQMLRSKGKASQVWEKTRAQGDEQSRSDKKNHEPRHKRAETANEGPPNEKKSTFIPAEETRRFWEKYKMTEGQFLCKSESTPGQGDGGDRGRGRIQEETATENHPGNDAVKPKQGSSSPRQRRKGSRKLRMTTAATFSQSPVYREREIGRDEDSDANRFNAEQRASEAAFEHQAGSTASVCALDPADPQPERPASSSEQIDLIESSLCGLKAQLLDLESTLKENLQGHSPTGSDTQEDEQHGGQAVEPGQHGLVRTFNTQEARLNVAYEEEPLPGQARQDQIPEVFQNISPKTAVFSQFSVLVHASNQPEEENEAPVGCQCRGHPSDLWFLRGSGSELASEGHPSLENQLTPERGDEFQGGFGRIKRRPAKNETDRNSSDDGRGQGSALRLSPSGKTWTFTGQGCHKCGQNQPAAFWPEGDGGGDEKEQEEQVLVAGVRSLQEERSGQREELLQPDFTPPERLRPLLAAAARGFLTRRLFRTERVKKLVDVARDMQQLLNTLQQPSSLRKEIVTLKALLHLNAARAEISEIFFGVPAGVRMQIISQDRELVRERELRQKSVHTGRRKSCLSAATQRSLERKSLLAAIKLKGAAEGQLYANCASSPRIIL